MKRLYPVTALLLILAVLLSACGQQGGGSAPQNEPERQSAVEVENNGGYYVRVGDKIYFRRYGADAPEKTALFGDFVGDWSAVNGGSELMVRDPSGEVKSLYSEHGRGPLFYADGGFYLWEVDGSEASVVWYAIDGSGSEKLCAGRPLGVTESGLLATEAYTGEGESIYTLYRGKQAVCAYTTETYTDFFGLTDDGLFLLETLYDSESAPQCAIDQITLTGERIRLGEVPEAENAPDFMYDVQPDHFLASGNKICFGVGYYAGTGHFLNELVLMEAETGKADSAVRIVSAGTDDEYPDVGAQPTVEADGSFGFAQALPGDLRIGWEGEEDGALEVYRDGEWRVLTAGLCTPPPDGFGYRRIEQHMEYVGGAAYVTLACAQIAPAEAIGWREAYTLLDMLYLRIDDSGNVQELDCVDHDAELIGRVWFIEGASVALWQQSGEEQMAEYAYAVPVADEAYDAETWDALFDNVTGILPYDYGEDELKYDGYPLPETEEAGFVSMRLDRDGNVVRFDEVEGVG